MKLNNDCIRDILLTLEELCTFENKFTYDIESQPPHLLAKYSREEVLYLLDAADGAFQRLIAHRTLGAGPKERSVL